MFFRLPDKMPVRVLEDIVGKLKGTISVESALHLLNIAGSLLKPVNEIFPKKSKNMKPLS